MQKIFFIIFAMAGIWLVDNHAFNSTQLNNNITSSTNQNIDHTTGVPLPPRLDDEIQKRVVLHGPQPLQYTTPSITITDAHDHLIKYAVGYYSSLKGKISMTKGIAIINDSKLTMNPLADIPMDCYLYFKGKGYAKLSIDHNVIDNNKRSIHIRLKKGANIFGHIYSVVDGKPLGGIVIQPRLPVEASANQAWNSILGGVRQLSITDISADFITRDGDGFYDLMNMPQGTYIIKVLNIGNNSNDILAQNQITLKEEQIIDKLDFYIPISTQAKQFAGHIYLANNETPLRNEEIIMIFNMINPRARIQRRICTNYQGYFNVFPLLNTSYYISIPNYKLNDDIKHIDLSDNSITNSIIYIDNNK
jgi:hypothetical protein